MKIIAAVPTYNRPELLLRNIDCLLRQTRPLDRIVIVDNASEAETRQAMEGAGYLSHPLIEYVRVDVNVGASGGFGIGMETAMARGADWIWGMDDDAFPRMDALEQLLISNADKSKDCLWSNVDDDDDFAASMKTVDHLIFVGFFLSRRLVEKVGYPDVRFYMYHDDTDYSRRIISNGYKIHKVRDSIIDHKAYNRRGKAFSSFGFSLLEFSVMNAEPFRIYYIFRNTLYVQDKISRLIKLLFVYSFIELPKYLLMRPRSGALIFLAIAHYLLKKRGRVVFSDKFNKGYYE